MKKKFKISLIGAGTATFSLSLIKDLCLSKHLDTSEVSLMDINQERLDDAHNLCVRYAKELGSNLTITKTSNRQESLENTDFVILTALVGGHYRLKDGWDIAKKHGYKFGGSLHVVHDEPFWINFYQVKLMEDVYKDIQKICPQAWMLIVSNPVMMGITYLKRKYRDSKIVGLCHGYGAVYELAKTLGLEREKISFEILGVNHFVWLNKFNYNGEDAFPLIDEWIEKKSEKHWEECFIGDEMGPKKIDLYKRYGVYPVGDTGSPGGGAWGWWYHSDGDVQAQYKEDPDFWYNNYFESTAKNVETIRNAAHNGNAKIMDLVPPEHSNEPMIPIIEALAYDIEGVHIVNILNSGNYVNGIPLDFEVEIPALVSKRGIQGIKTFDLPKPVVSLALRDRVASVNMEIEAFESGKMERLEDLVMMDPWTTSKKQAQGLINEILDLPYHKELREHFS